MSNKELLLCPFCGSEAKLKEFVDPYDSCIWSTEVFCSKCRAIMYGDEDDAVKAWNTRNYLEKQDSSNVEQSVQVPEVVENGNCKYLPDECCEKSCKEENTTFEPLVPKWQVWGYNDYILRIPISQQDALQFVVRSCKDNKYMCEVGISVSDVEEIGTFNTLEEAKQKVNECIRELGEKLVYFAENIRTED